LPGAGYLLGLSTFEWVPVIRTHSGTFTDGDLRVNKDDLHIVSWREGGEVSRPL
jgi:hypothetical protein